MYKLNYKAIMLVFFCQVLAAVVWYYLAPSLSLLESAADDDMPQYLSINVAILLFLSTFVQVLFIAWLLIRVKGTSAFGRLLLVISMWLFIVLPNYAILSLYLSLASSAGMYLLSYGAMNYLIIALILPFWRSSRSIFKD